MTTPAATTAAETSAATPGEQDFLQHVPNRGFLLGSIAAAVVYILVLGLAFEHGNTALFWLLIATEVFHLAQLVGYAYTVWSPGAPRVFAPE